MSTYHLYVLGAASTPATESRAVTRRECGPSVALRNNTVLLRGSDVSHSCFTRVLHIDAFQISTVRT